jgi:hypothetical protein
MIKIVDIFLKKTQHFQIVLAYNSLYHYIMVCAHEYTHVLKHVSLLLLRPVGHHSSFYYWLATFIYWIY